MKRAVLLILLAFCGSISARNIEFAGRTWYVHNGNYGPGPNYFSDDISNVWLDTNGFLHLRLRESGGEWYCPNIETVETTGYGMHRFYIRGAITNLDPNIIFSPFAYYDTSHEIDIEFARWGNTTPGIHNAQFVVQPHGNAGNLHTYRLSQITEDTTHYFDWSITNIHFKSFQGHYLEEQTSGDIIQEWNYNGIDNPDESYDLKIHIITWLLNGNAPINDQELEMIVTGVDYPCYETPTFSASDGIYSNFIKITWTKVDSADNYEVWRSLDNVVGNAVKIGDNILTNFYDDSLALSSTNYYYWVVGENPFGTSRFGTPDIGWYGETNSTSGNSLNFFFDGFTRKNGNSYPERKWAVAGWSSGGDFNYCSNNMCYIFPGNGDWNWRGIRQMNVDGSDCVLNVAEDIGVTVSINLENMDISVTNTTEHDASLNIAILNIPVTGNPYEMDAKGLLLYADYYVETGKINLRLYRKNAPNSSGTKISDVEKNYIPGVKISLTFAKDDAKVIYNGGTIFDGPHGFDTSPYPNWYTGFVVQNRDYGRCKYFLDNARITAFGNAFADSFNDDFSSATLNNSKWFNSSGSIIIENNKCKLTPENTSWGIANLGMKIDQWNPLKLKPNLMPIFLNVQLTDINISAINSSGPELTFKTELYPERNYNTSWNYNFTNLSISTDININSGATSLNVIAQLFTKVESFQNLINETVTYIPNAVLETKLTENDIVVSYNGVLLNNAAHNINIGTVYENGIFPMLIAQNYDSGRGSVYIDNANISLIPEPCYLLFIIYQLLFIKYCRRIIPDRK